MEDENEQRKRWRIRANAEIKSIGWRNVQTNIRSE